MTDLTLPRRKFLAGAAAFLAAPAIVRVTSLMPVKVERDIIPFIPDNQPPYEQLIGMMKEARVWVFANPTMPEPPLWLMSDKALTRIGDVCIKAGHVCYVT
jgi:hypothetical protein